MSDRFDFSPEAIARLAAAVRRALAEEVGGVTFDRLRELAERGVDRISIGTLTQDVKATDFSMRFKEI